MYQQVIHAEPALPKRRAIQRYPAVVRVPVGTLAGVIAGVGLIGSMQVGVAFGLTGAPKPEWTILLWDDHWVWRAIAAAVATAGGGFIAAMAARRHGAVVGAASAVPSLIYWLYVASAGWSGRVPGSSTAADIPIGYRIIATVLALAVIPIGAATGREGSAYGRANAEHFDSRRRSLFGIRWYHFLWLPFLIHFMLITGAFGSVYGFQWVVTAFRNGFSFFGFIPVLFVIGMFGTLALLGTGAARTYEALSGFDDDSGLSVSRRVFKYGFGYSIGTIAAQAGIAVLHFGLVALARKLFG